MGQKQAPAGFNLVLTCQMCGSVVATISAPNLEEMRDEEAEAAKLVAVVGDPLQAQALVEMGVQTVDALASLTDDHIVLLDDSKYGQAKLRAWRKKAREQTYAV
jgi:predicted flap endonuclease-1-like 5' DNA nuclease